MSRRLPSSQRPPSYQPARDNHYQTTTLTTTLPVPHTYNHQNAAHVNTENFKNLCTGSYRTGGLCNKIATYDTGVSDETCSDTNTYYDHHHFGYQYTCKNEPKNSDCMFSDSDNQLSYYECGETLPKRFSRHNFHDPAGVVKKTAHREKCNSRKVYPNQSSLQRPAGGVSLNLPIRLPTSRISDRPQSSLSSGVTSTVVDGCGGHCQTFENICYYFLQVAFTMGILIGTSLSIAGAVLRKSAARNLQVLVYIGALLSMVSALLLAIQCSARYNVQKRKKALKNAKRSTIPLETIHTRPVVLQQQPLINDRNPALQRLTNNDQQGIPWWRRKDLN
ncbi:hypothetical protein PPYR_13889 [Photinus pyralis]|uniref:Uncharacterized protein n=1 Tax=Photinus pyralis TaxID=7054 RepID=A0A1Y1LM24_PHOPY|nr:uncharacterized protein LOC116179873 [Photinus pyralis]XP_031355605.1 uncharacterized protein LOC116179873 [Photinus pyralis]XP_031355606.1 uncharacterized protein LOC116179873 [Photinus pyralis]KAB0794269.1 hypothetical protein PPYR_13889 [Photinus pyralis]